MYNFLKDYQPEPETDGFEPFKGLHNCAVNYARFEDYKGDKEEFKGRRFFRYELEVCDGQENAGRRLWKSVDTADEDKMKRLANSLFTIGLSFKSEAELQACAEQLVLMTLLVKTWYFTPKDSDDPIQMHAIKDKGNKEAVKANTCSAPF